jgi:ribosomal protein S17E
MGRVRKNTIEKAARVIIEKYYTKLTLDFKTNKRIIKEIATIHSKTLRIRIARWKHIIKSFFMMKRHPSIQSAAKWTQPEILTLKIDLTLPRNELLCQLFRGLR